MCRKLACRSDASSWKGSELRQPMHGGPPETEGDEQALPTALSLASLLPDRHLEGSSRLPAIWPEIADRS